MQVFISCVFGSFFNGHKRISLIHTLFEFTANIYEKALLNNMINFVVRIRDHDRVAVNVKICSSSVHIGGIF